MMEVRRDVLLGIITLVVFYIGLSFAAVGLQQRLEPTVTTIKDRNVVSIALASEFLAILEDGDHAQMRALADRLHTNVTEDGEAEITRRIAATVEGDVSKKTNEYQLLVKDLDALIGLNRQAMVEYSEQAFRLAQSGGWVLITLALLAIWASWFVVHRLQQRIVQPLERLAETMRHGRSGTTRMRAYAQYAAYEIREAADALNALLDDRAMNYEHRRAKIARPERNIVVALMEKVPYPTWILDENGEIRAANQQGMEKQQGREGRRVKGYLRAIATEHMHGARATYPAHAFEAVDLGDEDHLLCMLLDSAALMADD